MHFTVLKQEQASAENTLAKGTTRSSSSTMFGPDPNLVQKLCPS